MEIRTTRLYLPSGAALVTPPYGTATALAMAPSVRVTPDAGLNTTFLLAPAVTGVSRDITTFGATPNNSSNDDGPAIRNAINACVAGDEVFIPNGTFHIKGSTPITGKNGVSIRGQSRSGAILTTMYTGQPNSCLLIPTDANDLTLSDFSINLTSGPSPLAGIRLGSSETGTATQNSRITIGNVQVEGFQRFGIELANSRHVLVENCVIKNATALDGGGSGYGVIVFLPGADNNWIRNNTIGPVIRHGIVIANSTHHNLIELNEVFNTVSDAIDCHGEDEYSCEIRYNTVHDGLPGQVTISPSISGIGVGEWSGVEGTTTAHDNSGPNHWVHHNEVYNCNYGFFITNQSNFCFVEDNYFHDNINGGIRATLNRLNNLSLVRNTVQNNAQGVQLDDVTTVAVKDNIITGNTGFGLQTNAGTTGYVITGNTITGNGTNISLGSGSGTYVP